MSLPAGQQRILDVIESALEASESRLTAMFAMFARLTREEPVGAERLPRRTRQRRTREHRSREGRGLRWRAANSILLVPVLGAIVLMTGLVVSVATGGTSACGFASPAHAFRTVLTCPAPASPPAAHPGSGRFGGIG